MDSAAWSVVPQPVSVGVLVAERLTTQSDPTIPDAQPCPAVVAGCAEATTQGAATGYQSPVSVARRAASVGGDRAFVLTERCGWDCRRPAGEMGVADHDLKSLVVHWSQGTRCARLGGVQRALPSHPTASLSELEVWSSHTPTWARAVSPSLSEHRGCNGFDGAATSQRSVQVRADLDRRSSNNCRTSRQGGLTARPTRRHACEHVGLGPANHRHTVETHGSASLPGRLPATHVEGWRLATSDAGSTPATSTRYPLAAGEHAYSPRAVGRLTGAEAPIAERHRPRTAAVSEGARWPTQVGNAARPENPASAHLQPSAWHGAVIPGGR